MEKAAVFTPGMVPIKNQELNANSIVIKTSAAMLFSVLGVMAFFYSTWNRNFESAVWCIPLEIACILLLIFNKPHIEYELPLNYNAPFFRALKIVSLVFCVAAWVTTLIYIIVAFANGEYTIREFTPRSYFVAGGVSFFAGGSCLVLFFDSKKYVAMLRSQEAKL